MPTIYSSDLKLSIMATGENAGTWGSITNTNLFLLQQAIGGYQEVNIAGGAQTTALAMSDGALSNARNAVIKLTGTITGNQVVTIPNGIEKTYIISNGTTGAFTVEFKTASGTGVTFGTTDKSTRILFADGTNIVDTGTVSESGVQTLTNKTLTSPIINEIDDANGNEQVIFSSTASAVNELTITNAATGNAPSISTTGSDTNIGLTIAPKGTGDVNVDADTLRIGDSNADATITTNGTGDLTLSTNAGSNSGTIKIFDAANGNIEITPNGTGVVKLDGLSYPTADGSANQALVTNGSGVLSFATPAAGSYVFLGETTASNVASVSLDGYFTSDYDIYKIFVDGLYGSSNDVGVRITFNKSGSEETNSYAGSLFYMIATGSNTGSTSFDANLSNSYMFGGYSNSADSYNGTSFDITLYNPLGTNNHKVLTFLSNNNTGDLTRQIVAMGSAMHRVQSAISGIRFKMGSGNIYARKLKIYGVKNS